MTSPSASMLLPPASCLQQTSFLQPSSSSTTTTSPPSPQSRSFEKYPPVPFIFQFSPAIPTFRLHLHLHLRLLLLSCLYLRLCSPALPTYLPACLPIYGQQSAPPSLVPARTHCSRSRCHEHVMDAGLITQRMTSGCIAFSMQFMT